MEHSKFQNIKDTKKTKNFRINPRNLGKMGEEQIFPVLKEMFPSLINVSDKPLEMDFFDPVNNIRFEIKTKEEIRSEDYQHTIMVDNLRRPKLTVFISNIEEVTTRIHFCPNILIINAKEIIINSNFWKDFILGTKWERENEIIDKYHTLSLSREIEKMKKILDKDEPTNDTGPSTNSIDSSRIITELVMASAIKSVDEGVDDNKIKGVLNFVEQEGNFLVGYNTHHLKKDYVTYCEKNSISSIVKSDLLHRELRKYCVQYNPTGSRHPFYIVKTTKFGMELVQQLEEFKILHEKIDVGKNKNNLFPIYVEHCRKLDLIPMSKRSFTMMV